MLIMMFFVKPMNSTLPFPERLWKHLIYEITHSIVQVPAPTAETQIGPLCESFVALGGCCCL